MCALIARRFIATTPRWRLTRHAQRNANFTTSLIVNNPEQWFSPWLVDQRRIIRIRLRPFLLLSLSELLMAGDSGDEIGYGPRRVSPLAFRQTFEHAHQTDDRRLR
jgi:hypothetical protein